VAHGSLSRSGVGRTRSTNLITTGLWSSSSIEILKVGKAISKEYRLLFLPYAGGGLAAQLDRVRRAGSESYLDLLHHAHVHCIEVSRITDR